MLQPTYMYSAKKVWVLVTAAVLIFHPITPANSQTSSSLSSPCDPSGWCVEYSQISATLDGNPTTPDVIITYHASEPLLQGKGDSKWYRVQVMDSSCRRFVRNDAMTPHDDPDDGIVPNTNYDATDSTLSVGLDLDTNNIETSSFATQEAPGSTILSVVFCVKVELLTGMPATSSGNGQDAAEAEPPVAVAVALETTAVGLVLDTRTEQGFEITNFSSPPTAGAGMGTTGPTDVVITTMGLNSKGEPIDTTGLAVDEIGSEIQEALQHPDHLAEATYDLAHGFPIRYRIQTGDPASSSTITDTFIGRFSVLGASQATLHKTNMDLWTRQGKPSYDYNLTDQAPNSNLENVIYPLTVRVRDGVVVQAINANGNELDFEMVPRPLTIDQYFNEIGKQISLNAPYIENLYDGSFKGYPTNILMVTETGRRMDIVITQYQDTNLLPLSSSSTSGQLRSSSFEFPIKLKYDPSSKTPVVESREKKPPTLLVARPNSKQGTTAAPPANYEQITANQEEQTSLLTQAQTIWKENDYGNYKFAITKQCDTCHLEYYPWVIQINRNGQYNMNVQLNYPLDKYFCDDANQPIPTPTNLLPGQSIQFCIRSAAPKEVRVVNLRNVRFENVQDRTLAIPIVDETGSTLRGQPSSISCREGGICRVTSLAYVRLYEKLDVESGQVIPINEGARIVGTCILEFVSTGNRRNRRSLAIETSNTGGVGDGAAAAERRKLQGGGGGGSGITGFDLDVKLATPPPKKHSSSSGSTISASTGLLVSVMVAAAAGAGVSGFLCGPI